MTTLDTPILREILRKRILDEQYDLKDLDAEFNDRRTPCSACGIVVYDDAMVGDMCARCASGSNDFDEGEWF